ncbi:RimJ/RimL family protein N-acetyltransferase [Evansella vedderi]|uniref:RimJ/RimL family protein N-acetyltransferase n=1 Tax=Evansella vedderi TaxID=38282 RepID=A0ABU0A6R4_9BACI|nr:GNAT family protein [Evansella vedderi]MDQ0258025.1 RimJ/RimL family protein N-acetyltransferase [Evansella vedderi]
MKIREIRTSDADSFLEVNHQLDNETSFMLYEPGERKTTVEKQKIMLERVSKEKTSNIWVLENDVGKLVGYLALFGQTLQRNSHSAYIVVGIIEDYQGQGLGKKLFIQMEEWAKEKGIHRLELTVMKHNYKALQLYLKMGFEIEGVKRDSLKVNGEYVDEYYLSKLI